ncbi:hypothetical protein BWQ96_05177 [Gracilariopsis chorda]|uniref:Uncharacterized protein n=1 Tax=Gracilariopsis chorda TaxID=448386 RepID=A0A2V3ISH1_9FLOR|nr:hypothetical protein BWQ96_05177 [Gracilariopsis chorda]|eukprot:PXF45075.1 hypothetical protein BWQ96_05177 [Gracilariopsis chorda]
MVWDPRPGFWSVVVTECAVCTASYILAEAYDPYRLWYIQPRVRAAIRRLDMRVPLGGVANAEEMLSLLDFLEGVNWDEVPIDNSQRRLHHNGSGPGLGRNTALAGDYIFFDPWEYRELTREEAEDYRNAPRMVPPDHPRGFVDLDDYYRSYIGGDPMVDNEPDDAEMAEAAVPSEGGADGVADGSVQHGVSGSPGPSVPTGPSPATAASLASAPTASGPETVAPPTSVPTATVREPSDSSDVIAQFL